jgi:plastocyanin
VSDAVHTVTANNGAFDSGDIATAGSTSVWHFAPKQTGTFPYYCKYHPLMHGTLIVTS